MASSSAPNIFSGSMSFSRETCRMTDGSMIIAKPLSSLHLIRPCKIQPYLPNIGETDIIDSAILPINDCERFALDFLEHSPEVARRQQGRLSRRADRLGHDRRVRAHGDAAADEAPGVLERIEPAVEAG